MRVYGSSISYYTGKLEGYLRYKEIPYEFVPMTARVRRRVARHTGASQMPAVELPDGRWMTDTTPMIDWFEARYPEPAVIPHEPLLGFVARLLEDYAEEWHWRPAMHYRWSHAPDRELLGRRIADEVLDDVPLPGALKRGLIRARQRVLYVQRDGVSQHTRAHVEGIYLKSLEQLSAIFERRPYLLGDRPTLADFGFFASMFRHFAQDPTPAELMRRRAPLVYAWQARLWSARASHTLGAPPSSVPDDLGPLFDEIGSGYLPMLNENARAWAAGNRRYDARLQGVSSRDMLVSHYRVWCLERLRRHFEALEPGAQAQARALLEAHGCWQPLFAERIDARYPEGEVPFRGVKVHYDVRRTGTGP